MDAVESNISEVLAKLSLEEQARAASLKFTLAKASQSQLQELAYEFAVRLIYSEKMLKDKFLEQILQAPLESFNEQDNSSTNAD